MKIGITIFARWMHLMIGSLRMMIRISAAALVTAIGDRIGIIDDLLVDRDHKRVAGIRLEDGRVFPVEPLLIRDEVVVLLGATESVEGRRRFIDGTCTVRRRSVTRQITVRL